ncbi:hypothetical protein LUZ60_011953 [Juncus effusus]|nr:hypothetical protein LUZ60_011953 [Juncus effusus]
MAFQARSISLPTKSHSYVLKAEAEFYKLRACLSSSSQTAQTILDALQGVCNLYECINDIFFMSSNQNSLSHSQQRRVVDQELEDSVNLLDICSTSSDNLAEIKAHLQDLESAVRRCSSEAMKSKAKDYIHLVKKSSKYLNKQVGRKSESIEGDSLETLGLVREAREIAVSLLQSVLVFFSKQIVSQKTSKWSLLQKRRVECKGDVFDISSLIVNVEELHNGLGCIVNVEELHNGLGCLYRHMIQCSVSLLNSCSL